jgi:hypothetical protein
LICGLDTETYAEYQLLLQKEKIETIGSEEEDDDDRHRFLFCLVVELVGSFLGLFVVVEATTTTRVRVIFRLIRLIGLPATQIIQKNKRNFQHY